ncbi:hypothetical protein [Bradyrhizobium sp. HKCCYLR20261]|uniref:hypothetical protein n=1 Tax=Bradyrhizobium sp. HKCCYLR20261 TaxID=3420760 RepID=UPI003EBB813E
MVDQREDPSQVAKVRPQAAEQPEAVWVREFLGVGGTDNVTRFCIDDLNGVTLVRAVEAAMCGDLLWAEKCDGVGTQCMFDHSSDDDRVQVLIWFSSNEARLEIRRAASVKENDREPNAA